MRRRRPSCDSGPGPAHPRTRGGPTNAQRSHSHTAWAFPLSPCAWFAHRARAQHPSECCSRWTLCGRAMRTMSGGWWKCQLYVPPCFFGRQRENFTNGAGACIRYPWWILIVMMYTRASASDYDDWEKVHENPGWGSNDLIPLLRKVFTPHIRLVLLYTYSVRLSPVPPRRQRRTKFPLSGRLTEPTARSRSLQVRWLPISENSFSKSRVRLIPPARRRRLTQIRTIYRRSMYTPWVFYCSSHFRRPNECILLHGRLNKPCSLRDGPSSCMDLLDVS